MITIIAIVLVIVVAACMGLSNYFYNLALNPRRNKGAVLSAPHNALDIDREAQEKLRQESRDWFAAADAREATITAEDGVLLRGYTIEAEAKTDKWLIACHGYIGNAMQMVGTARNFNRLGYNVLIPDCRGHGESEGDYIGMGWHDRRDMICWINDIITRHGEDAQIVLYGVSMGGAAVMMTAGESDLPPNVKAVVEDCGYTSAWDEFSYQLKELYGLPTFPLMYFCSLITRLRAGYFLGEASAMEQVAKAKVPILFIHGEEDTFVPASMLDQVYQACASEKEKLLIPGAGHAGAWSADPALYDETVLLFLSRYITD